MEKTYPMALVTAPGRIEFQERKLPEFHDGSVLVQVRAASICGSDLHIFRGKYPGSSLPMALGHEAAGEVVRVGKDVRKVREGDRVVIEPVIACGKCDCCRRGDYNYCSGFSRPFRKGQGSFTPYVVVDEVWAHKLPPDVSFAAGALVEPLSVAVHAMKRANAALGHSVAIFGAGPIGLMVLHVARISGAGPIFVVDINEHRLDKATKFGASHTLNAAIQDVVTLINEKTDGTGVDRAFEAAGQEKTLVDCMKVLRQGGTAVVLGTSENPEVRIPADLIRAREISLVGSRGYCWDFEDAIKLLKMGTMMVEEMVTHVMPVSKLQQACELLLTPNSDAVKVVMSFD